MGFAGASGGRLRRHHIPGTPNNAPRTRPPEGERRFPETVWLPPPTPKAGSARPRSASPRQSHADRLWFEPTRHLVSLEVQDVEARLDGGVQVKPLDSLDVRSDAGRFVDRDR